LVTAPLIAAEVVRQTDRETEFRNGAALEVGTNDVSLIRGRSAIAVLGSEACHWQTDETSASSDEEVVAAAEPSMAMVPDGGLLILGSSVYRKRGYMHRRWQQLFAKDGAEDLCWLAPSRVMNPRLPERVVAAALEADTARASAEYMSQWRSDLEAYVSREVVEACVAAGVYERPRAAFTKHQAFVDMSGGQADSSTLAIAHRAGNTAVLDVVREIVSPQSACGGGGGVRRALQALRMHEGRGRSLCGSISG
jgi:hypothetical protein